MRSRNAGSDPKIRAGREPGVLKKREGGSADALLGLLKKKFESVGLTAELGSTSESGSGRKMSEVLLEFIEPYLHYAQTGEILDRLVTTAVLAWNASLLPEEKRAEFLDEAGRAVFAEDGRQAADDFRSAMCDLVKRKQRLFSKDERIVVNYEFRTEHGRDKLVVASVRGASRDSKEPD
jgi:hypothetical protein